MTRTGSGARREKGQTLALFVLALVALVGMVALTIDVGMYMLERRHLQNAADAAALAAAQELPDSSAAAIAKAQEWAEKNGYGPGSGATIEVETPYDGDSSKVMVKITTDVPALFSRVLGKESFSANGRGVARRGIAELRHYAIITLNETACDAFQKAGSGDVVVTGGGAIAVNSKCQTAINVSGSGTVSAAAIYYYNEGGWVSNGRMSPYPMPMPRRAADPLADVEPPDLALLAQSPDSGGTAQAPALLHLSNGATTLHPGIYYGGLKISSNTNVQFEPGIYIMAGGGFDLSGNGLVTGNGVMFYNTYDPQHNSDAGACTGSTLSGGRDASFQPMTDGPYANILFWQDRACTQTFTHVGNGQITTGVYYLPTAQFRQSGTADTGGKQIIADTVFVTGNSNVDIASAPFLTEIYEPVRLIE